MAQYTNKQEDEDKDDDLVISQPPVTHKKVLHSLHQLRRYKKENKHRNIVAILDITEK
jgi:uncharacterized membrane protein YukC